MLRTSGQNTREFYCTLMPVFELVEVRHIAFRSAAISNPYSMHPMHPGSTVRCRIVLITPRQYSTVPDAVILKD